MIDPPAEDVLDEDALDFLNDDERRLVKAMLKAVVEHGDIYNNGFSVSREGDQFVYHLANGNRSGPFQNRQKLPTNITDRLVYHKIAGRRINPQWPDSFRSFTPGALEWHRQYGGPDPDEIRRKIGRSLYRKRNHEGMTSVIRAEELAAELNLPVHKVNDQLQFLLKQNHLKSELRGTGMGFGILSFTGAGELWAEGDFRSITAEPTQLINVNLSLQLDLQIENIINLTQQERRLSPEQIDELRIRLEDLKVELEKPAGQGRRQPFRDLLSFLGDTSGVASIVLPVLNDHRDKLDLLVDTAQTLFS